jgi:hypothetical protein
VGGHAAPQPVARAGRTVRGDSLSASLFGRPFVAPLASLIIPGSGQLINGQERGLMYLATEAWAVARAIARSRQGRHEREHYEDLAFRVARQQFATERGGAPFSYYETLGEFTESGEFDLDPGPGFMPETSSVTFNGSVWALARETFFEDPDNPPPAGSPPYQAAIEFYSRRAVSGQFRWSWRNARLEQDVFRAAIRASDEAFRAATNYLGVLVLNHLGSTVDALITWRLRGQRAMPRLTPGRNAESVVISWQFRF